MRNSISRLIIGVACSFMSPLLKADSSFANFESPQAHSLQISADGSSLYAVNTPANLLTVYSLQQPESPELKTEIPVGIEPVSVAVRSEKEIWVVNHISDSISVIDLELGVVTATIAVGDRPGDIVFTGAGKQAFVSSMTERAVYVIDASSRHVVKKIQIAGHNPRSLLASHDGSKVWVAIFHSGNQTTVVPHDLATDPPKASNENLPSAPKQGIIVSTNDRRWQKQLKVNVTDDDVFEIDVSELKVTRTFSKVGTILFNMALHPSSDNIWVANTEARNLVRFEPALRGHVVDNRVSVINRKQGLTSAFWDLNEGLDYSMIPNKSALESSLAQPTDLVFNQTGTMAFVTSYGTDRIGILDESGSVVNRIEVGESEGAITNTRNKRGPRALALHPGEQVLYTLNRLSNSISVIDLSLTKQTSEIEMQDPTPLKIREGRGYLFDAKLSGNGTVSCASCHIDADRDGLAWDLGDPGGKLFNNGSVNPLHPMKGPLMTQTLRGLAGERIFHWRADRPGLNSFNGTFPNLMGGELLADEDMQLFADYMQTIRFGSNPISVSADSIRGEEIFNSRLGIAREGKNSFRCVDCHKRESGSGSAGFTGLIGQSTKAAQLRGLNERMVFAGNARVNGFGFGADGSKETLSKFLEDTHRFKPLSVEDRKSLEAFLLTFPTETPAIVGKVITVRQAQAEKASTLLAITAVLEQSQGLNCPVKLTGRLDGNLLNHWYIADDNSFSTGDVEDSVLTLEQILKALVGDQKGVISLTVHPD